MARICDSRFLRRNKLMIGKSIGKALVSVLVLAAAAPVRSFAAVSAGMTDIVVEAGDMVSINVETVEGYNISYDLEHGAAGDQSVAVERRPGGFLVRIAGADEAVTRRGKGSMAAIVTLRIPKGRNVSIKGRNMVVSGNISAKSLRVKALSVSMHALKVSAGRVDVDTDYGQFRFTLSETKELSIRSRLITGRVFLPGSARVTCPSSKEFTLVRT